MYIADCLSCASSHIACKKVDFHLRIGQLKLFNQML